MNLIIEHRFSYMRIRCFIGFHEAPKEHYWISWCDKRALLNFMKRKMRIIEFDGAPKEHNWNPWSAKRGLLKFMKRVMGVFDSVYWTSILLYANKMLYWISWSAKRALLNFMKRQKSITEFHEARNVRIWICLWNIDSLLSK